MSSISSDVIDRVRISTGGAVEAQLYFDQLADLYVRDFRSDFESDREKFRKNLLEDYIASPNSDETSSIDPTFKMITAWDEGDLVGFVYGASLPQGTGWWQNIKEPLDQAFIAENGLRTFAIFDLLVKHEYRRQRLASRLCEYLLRDRAEQRVTLLSSKVQQPAYAIYRKWGYQTVGSIKGEEGNTLDVFVRPLTLT
jgi:ribosomal protein S18 acetylase RimI-like enzyme